MKNAYRAFRRFSRQFWRNWLEYLILFGSLDLVNQLIIIPFFRWVTTYVLQAGELPFVSYRNTLLVLTHHPFVIIALLVEVVILLLLIYAEFMIILEAMVTIGRPDFTWKAVWHQASQAMRLLTPGSLCLLAGYFFLVLPFADTVFRTPLLAKIHVPQFIMDYLTRNNWFAVGIGFFYLVMIMLGVRLLLTLPLVAYRHLPFIQAMRRSWQLTGKGKWLPLVGQLLFATILISAVTVAFDFLIYGLQVGLDLLPGKFPLITAVINLSLLQLGGEVLGVWAGTVILLMLTAIIIKDNVHLTPPPAPSKGLVQTFLLVFLVICLVVVVNNVFYLRGTTVNRPLTISHRGVAEENGVQNTIPALEKTVKLQPDYVEMDVHETKDHQFVVFHDENLKELGGVDKTPHQLTLQQLTRLTVRENGHQAKLASLDQYLAVAEKHHQKLLVEVKTTPQDSKQMLRNFNRRYGARLLRDHDQVHSLDYGAVTELKRLNPRLTVLHIQPYDFGNPAGKADGYSMEYSTLTQDFITRAHWKHQPVYAWTTNETGVMKQMMYNQADGLITDNLRELQAAIAEFTGKQTYANRILNYLIVVPTSQGLEP